MVQTPCVTFQKGSQSIEGLSGPVLGPVCLYVESHVGVQNGLHGTLRKHANLHGMPVWSHVAPIFGHIRRGSERPPCDSPQTLKSVHGRYLWIHVASMLRHMILRKPPKTSMERLSREWRPASREIMRQPRRPTSRERPACRASTESHQVPHLPTAAAPETRVPALTALGLWWRAWSL